MPLPYLSNTKAKSYIPAGRIDTCPRSGYCEQTSPEEISNGRTTCTRCIVRSNAAITAPADYGRVLLPYSSKTPSTVSGIGIEHCSNSAGNPPLEKAWWSAAARACRVKKRIRRRATCQTVHPPPPVPERASTSAFRQHVALRGRQRTGMVQATTRHGISYHHLGASLCRCQAVRIRHVYPTQTARIPPAISTDM